MVVVLNFSKPKHTAFKRNIWQYKDGDYQKFRTLLTEINWDNILQNDNIETISTDYGEHILSAAKQSIPNKLPTIRPNDIPWMNSMVRKLIRKRHRLHKKEKRSNTEQAWSNFRKIRNETTKYIRIAKLDYKNSITNKIKREQYICKIMVQNYKIPTKSTDL